MKKKNLFLFTVLMALSISFCGVTKADEIKNVAVVDVNAVVAKSSQVNALKEEQAQKIKELQDWLNVVKQDVAKQSTEEGKQKLIKKYDAEFIKKQEAIKKTYAQKLMAIDKSISAVIAKEAKSNGYDLVLSKNMVLYGGTDITNSIMNLVK